MKKMSLLFAMVLLLLCAACSSGGDYPGEVLYNGKPIDRFLTMTREDVESEFGEPEEEQEYESERGIIKCSSFSNYDIEITYNRDSGDILCVKLNSYYCTFNGKKLTEKSTKDILKYFSDWPNPATGDISFPNFSYNDKYMRWYKYKHDDTQYMLDFQFYGAGGKYAVSWVRLISEELGNDWDYEW